MIATKLKSSSLESSSLAEKESISTAVSAVPGKMDPFFCLWSYQDILKKSLLIYLQKIGQTFKVDLLSFLQKMENLDPNIRFAPSLFSAYSQLVQFYEEKKIEMIFFALQGLKNALDEPYAQEVTFSSFLSEGWENGIICDLKKATPGDEKEKILFPLVHWQKDDFFSNHLKTSLTLLSEIEQNLYEEFIAYVARIKFLSSKKLISCTSPKFFGAIYLRPPLPDDDPIIYYLDMLAHEISHLHLYAMMGRHDIVMNDPNETYSSPLRPDPRPMYGLFHAAFVLARIIRTLRRYKNLEGKGSDLLAIKEKKFAETCQLIEQHGILTDIGLTIYQTLEFCAFEDQ